MGRKYKFPQLIEDKDTLLYWAKTCSGRGRTDYIFDKTFRRILQGRMLRWFGRDADNQTLSPHSLRHLKATTLARKGCPLKLASLLLDASARLADVHEKDFEEALMLKREYVKCFRCGDERWIKINDRKKTLDNA